MFDKNQSTESKEKSKRAKVISGLEKEKIHCIIRLAAGSLTEETKTEKKIMRN